jgi:cell wall-associated NlpC family hydrolase
VHGVGVDCINLLAAVYEACGLAQVGQLPHYAQQWHLHQADEVFAQGLDQHARRVQAPQPGDVVLFQFGRAHSHAGIWLHGNQFVHAYNRLNRAGVIVSEMTPEWAKRAPWFWTLLED